jgi:hypothetical protein
MMGHSLTSFCKVIKLNTGCTVTWNTFHSPELDTASSLTAVGQPERDHRETRDRRRVKEGRRRGRTDSVAMLHLAQELQTLPRHLLSGCKAPT